MPNHQKINRDLLQLIEGIKNDLLMRGTKEEDGQVVVELSNGLWRRIHNALGMNPPVISAKASDEPQKLPEHHKQWFSQLQQACRDGNLALMSCLDATSMEHRSVIALVGHEDGQFVMTPIGHLSPADNPYEAYLPPRTAQDIMR